MPLIAILCHNEHFWNTVSDGDVYVVDDDVNNK